MKKTLFLLTLISALFLAACSDEEAAPSEPKTEETESAPEESGPSQEELNTQMKAEAMEIDFVQANGGDLAPNTRVKATGKVSALDPSGLRGGDFMLSVEEDGGFGVYDIVNLNTIEIPLEENQTVTVYGTFNGKNDSGMPEITATIIE